MNIHRLAFLKKKKKISLHRANFETLAPKNQEPSEINMTDNVSNQSENFTLPDFPFLFMFFFIFFYVFFGWGTRHALSYQTDRLKSYFTAERQNIRRRRSCWSVVNHAGSVRNRTQLASSKDHHLSSNPQGTFPLRYLSCPGSQKSKKKKNCLPNRFVSFCFWVEGCPIWLKKKKD